MPLKNHAARLEYQRNYRKSHLKEAAAFQRDYRRRKPGRRTEYEWKKYFDLTVEAYKAQCVLQKGLCAVCGKIPRGRSEKTRKLHVDHDHKTGKRRDLLCTHCNKALGFLLDDIEILKRAILYLEKHNART